MIRKAIAAAALVLTLPLAQCAKAENPSAITPIDPRTPHIVVDQFGYLPLGEKIAILRDPVIGFDADTSYVPTATYHVIDAGTGETVFSDTPEAWRGGAVHDGSGDRVWHFDFSSVTTPGSYLIRSADGQEETGPFRIADDVYRAVFREAFRTFYYQRAGFAKTPPYADPRWADGASHLGPGQDAQARLFSARNDASTARDLRGGWYDAGDYNKYTNWTAEYCRTLLLSFTENPNTWGDDFGIPESGNGVSDLLDEVQYGLDWLMRMQNDNGSVLSVMGVAAGSPPSSAKGASYYGPASTSATLSTAGAFAYAAMIYGNSPAPGHLAYADELRNRAVRAWNWAEANPAVTFYNNDARDNSEGLAAGQQEVDESFRTDKRLAAAVYLYALTGDTNFRDIIEAMAPDTQLLKDDRADAYRLEAQDALLVYSHLPGAAEDTRYDIRDAFRIAMTAPLFALDPESPDDPYLAPVGAMHWGSNNVKARTGNILLDQLSGPMSAGSMVAVQEAASHYVHYLHGANPLGNVYLSNMEPFGAEDSVTEFYHLWFADGSAKWDSVSGSAYGPPPGFLVGGVPQNFDVSARLGRGARAK